MVGEKFGKLIVRSLSGKNNRGEFVYFCECECGNTGEYVKFRLTSGKTKSCGCIRTGPKVDDLSGKKFNMLTVVKYSGRDKHRTSLWECLCDCGSITIIKRNALGKQTSCGCHNKAVRQKTRGIIHPSWNPNLTDEDRELGRFVDGYREWCLDIKKKFNFTCVVCKDNKGGNLVSHHLESYHANKELRMNLDNGVCLCEDCHKKFHKKFGYRNNTKEQFNTFVNEQLESNKDKDRNI